MTQQTKVRHVLCKRCGQTKPLPADIALEFSVPKDICISCLMRDDINNLAQDEKFQQALANVESMIQNNVQRIFPEPKTALINWIEENFHDIDSYVFTCKLKDGVTMTVHDVASFIEALGLIESAKHTVFVSSENGDFKVRGDTE